MFYLGLLWFGFVFISLSVGKHLYIVRQGTQTNYFEVSIMEIHCLVRPTKHFFFPGNKVGSCGPFPGLRGQIYTSNSQSWPHMGSLKESSYFSQEMKV